MVIKYKMLVSNHVQVPFNKPTSKLTKYTSVNLKKKIFTLDFYQQLGHQHLRVFHPCYISSLQYDSPGHFFGQSGE